MTSRLNLLDHGISIQHLGDSDFALIHDYMAKSMRLIKKSNARDVNLRLGSYIRHQKNNPDIRARGNDLNVSRLYKVETIFPWIHELLAPYMKKACLSSYYGGNYYHSISWLQLNERCLDSLTTRGPHVDYPAYRQQIKYILYLNDVSLDNGPFCHYIKSHEQLAHSKILAHFQNTGSTDIPASLINEMDWTPFPCTGKKGTLIISDVGAVHYGMPQRTSSRSVIMGSIFPYPIEQSLGY